MMVFCGSLLRRAGARTASLLWSTAQRSQSSQSTSFQKGTGKLSVPFLQRSYCPDGLVWTNIDENHEYGLWKPNPPVSSGDSMPPIRLLLLPKTSLSFPPWPEIKLPDPQEEAKHHREVVQRVNELIATGQYGRLFAVVHFASRQWKVTTEDLILIENHIPAECGDRIRMEKVLLVGADDFTMLGKPLLGKDLVRVEATVIEKTESWPKVNMKFRRKCRSQRKRIIIRQQTVLRINSIEISPALS